jgi:tetratricopeptide (TPR) repeat protein
MQEQLNDHSGTMVALEHLAGLRRPADSSEAHWLYRRALSLASELDDRKTEARIRNSLAVLAWQNEDMGEAEKQYRMAAALLRRDQNRQELGVVLNGLGAVLTQLEQPDEALKILEEALNSNRESGQGSAEADSLSALGSAARVAGDMTGSGSWYQQCVERRRELGDRAGEGWALLRLSEVSQEDGGQQRADAFAAAALAIGREICDKNLELLATKLQSADNMPKSK